MRQILPKFFLNFTKSLKVPRFAPSIFDVVRFDQILYQRWKFFPLKLQLKFIVSGSIPDATEAEILLQNPVFLTLKMTNNYSL